MSFGCHVLKVVKEKVLGNKPAFKWESCLTDEPIENTKLLVCFGVDISMGSFVDGIWSSMGYGNKTPDFWAIPPAAPLPKRSNALYSFDQLIYAKLDATMIL